MSMFGGSPKCPKCGKAVYFNERVRALGEDWHKTCFSCTNCNKTLQLGAQAEHDGMPYCRPCHGKLFGPKGFGFGTLSETGLRGDGEKVDYAQSTVAREAEESSSRKTLRKSLGKSIASAVPSFMAGSGNQCAKCGKSVGFAERITALDATWHKDCFRCAECNKRLNKGEFTDSGGVAYCENCHKKKLGPKGYGYGNALAHSEMPSTAESE